MTRISVERARGVLMGQFVGDALGTTLEFRSASECRRLYPGGLRDIVGGGPFHMEAGQVTDDGELAVTLARTLIAHGLDLDARARAYAAWMRSNPPDKGNATIAAFSRWDNEVDGQAMMARSAKVNGDQAKQANGALMRVSPLAVFTSPMPSSRGVELAMQDAAFSHPSLVCQWANAVFVEAIRLGLDGETPKAGWEAACAVSSQGSPAVLTALKEAHKAPSCDGDGQGWVLVALRMAFHQLLHAESFEEGLISTVMAGGDTDTNGAIAGALMGAFLGIGAIPARWQEKVLQCRPASRPSAYHVHDALALADRLLDRGRRESEPARAAVRTSDTDPILVAWLPSQGASGRVGITLAPGKHGTSKSGTPWARDLDKDLECLRTEYKTDLLVCLLEDEEMERLRIPDLVEKAEKLGIEVVRLPIPDGGRPPNRAGVERIVEWIGKASRAGRNVVIHCQGGLGRAGTIGGCYLRDCGVDATAAEQILKDARGKSCPENDAQRRFIRAFR